MPSPYSRDMAAVSDEVVASADSGGLQPTSSVTNEFHMSALSDDHPEPTLEPVSDDKELAASMIPSTSNISLLLLNHQADEMLSKLPHMSNISIGMLQGTHAPWTSMASLGPRPGHMASALLHRDMPMLENDAQPFAMRGSQLSPPSSPYLDATLVAGSPLRLWLLSHPPSLRNNPMGPGRAVRRLLNLSQRPQLALSLSAVSVLTLSRRGILSPTLDPVQTPLEEPPMTPLNLGTSHSPRPHLIGDFTSSPEVDAFAGDID